MPNTDRSPPAEAAGSYREIVGTFRSREELEKAISELASAGWDRSEMSLLAQHGVLVPEDVSGDTPELADDEKVEREAVISEPDVRQGRTLAAGLAGVVGAFVASGATIMTGGTALAAIVGAAVVGGGAAAAMDVVGHRVDKHRSDFLREQVEHGGILLWARLREVEQEGTAEEILRRCGATDIHIHEAPAAAQPGARRAAPRDEVEEASMESFPASDPPAWTGTSARATDAAVSEGKPAPSRGQRTRRKS